MPSDKDLILGVVRIMHTVPLTYSEVAAATGTSPGTIRRATETNELPDRGVARLRIAKFVSRNCDARSRDEVRFVG
jgi:hypothetical protein